MTTAPDAAAAAAAGAVATFGLGEGLAARGASSASLSASAASAEGFSEGLAGAVKRTRRGSSGLEAEEEAAGAASAGCLEAGPFS